MARVLWGRVAMAAVAVPVGMWGFVVAGLWSTSPTPTPAGRSTHATDGCVASEVLVGGLAVGDAFGGAVVARAAQCATLGDLPMDRWVDTYQMIRDGLPTIRAEGAPAEALDQLLDVWELAHDEQNNGPLTHLAVWTAVALQTAPEVGQVLADPLLPADARAAAVPRLRVLAQGEVDWDHLRPHEERSMWTVMGRMAAEPSWWPGLLRAPHLVWVARAGTHPIVADLREDLVTLRGQARLLQALAAD